MIAKPIAADERQRARNREAQRRRRARLKDGQVRLAVVVDFDVLEQLVWRGFLADWDIGDREKMAEAMSEAVAEWAEPTLTTE